VVKPPER